MSKRQDSLKNMVNIKQKNRINYFVFVYFLINCFSLFFYFLIDDIRTGIAPTPLCFLLFIPISISIPYIFIRKVSWLYLPAIPLFVFHTLFSVFCIAVNRGIVFNEFRFYFLYLFMPLFLYSSLGLITFFDNLGDKR